MANLAIKGHPTRGSEVIALLEMLGGVNSNNLYGDKGYTYYIIDSDKEIKGGSYVFGDEPLCHFTLEEFEKKFPYKVGDNVNAPCKGCTKTITSMEWDTYLNTVSYKLDNRIYTNIDQLKVVNDLQPYKEETMSKNISDSCLDNEGCLFECTRKKQEREKETEKNLNWFLTDYLEFENNDDTWADEVEVNLGNDYEIQVRDGKTFIVKKKPQYPKTYIECAKILDCFSDVLIDGYKGALLEKIQELLIFRDAYWKIAGEQMRLGKPWKLSISTPIYYIYYNRTVGIIKKDYADDIQGNVILAFPTEEMRDTFFENFKKLIEECKELL